MRVLFEFSFRVSNTAKVRVKIRVKVKFKWGPKKESQSERGSE